MSVFTWGFGRNGQLGQGNRDNSLLPVEISFVVNEKSGILNECHQRLARKASKLVDKCKIEKAKCISAGGLMTGILTTNGSIYLCGSGTHGRLGTKEEVDHLWPVKIDNPCSDMILNISCGIWHGAAVTSEGSVFCWGFNKSHGVLGQEQQLSEEFLGPSLVTSLKERKIVSISCGNNYTLAIDDKGNLFSWGFGRHGVLGQGDKKDMLKPTHIKENINEKVISIDAGFAHCGVVLDSGKILMTGKGADGALGLGSSTFKDSMAFQPVQNVPNDIVFKELSCSKGEHHCHTLALTTEGNVYSWGDGYKAKLGHGDQESRLTPTLIDPKHFNDEKIKHVCAGGIHSTAVSEDGHAFTWGCGSDGRLGHPEAKGHRYLYRVDIPRVVEALKEKGKVIDIKSSYNHAVALVE